MNYEHRYKARVRYLADGCRLPDLEGMLTYGCWAFPYRNKEQVEAICDEALKNGVCNHIEHHTSDEGICYFFCHENDVEALMKITRFFVVKNLIPRDENGRLENLVFLSPLGEEEEEEENPLTLSYLIDLDTGEPTF